MAQSRITITIPPELIEAADKRAKEVERSRSWVLVEALRGYLDVAAGGRRVVREGVVAYAAGLGESRQEQLQADLDLSPEERVLIGEQTASVAALRGRRPRLDQVVMFDRYEDFLAWKARMSLEP